MKALRSVAGSLARNPIKSLLTLLTVGLGVAVLIMALSLSSAFAGILSGELEGEGIIVTLVNAEYT